MKYILLMYAEEGVWSPEEHGSAIQQSVSICQELADKGQFVGAGPLHPVATATSVRVREGKRQVTDGE